MAGEMNIPPGLMDVMQGNAPGAEPGGAGAPDNLSPEPTPAAAPQENAGERMRATTQVIMAMKVLEQALTSFGAGSEEGKVVVQCLSKLGAKFGEGREEGSKLIPSEIMNLVGSLQGSPGGSPAAPPGAGGMQPPAGVPPMA